MTALDDERPSDEEAREVVAALGVDVPALAARIRAMASASVATPEAKLRLAFEADRAKTLRASPVRPRDEQLARVRALMARAERQGHSEAVVAHFRKFEEAGDEELAAILTSLRELFGDEGD